MQTQETLESGALLLYFSHMILCCQTLLCKKAFLKGAQNFNLQQDLSACLCDFLNQVLRVENIYITGFIRTRLK